MRWKMIVGIIWITLNLIPDCLSVCSSLYGGTPCTFLPAPPGKTPNCARPGLTYCEHPDHYPGQLIHFLVQKWRYDHSTLFISESKEEFSSYFYPPPSTVYGPPNYQGGSLNYQNGGGSNSIPQAESFYPEPIYIPKPQYPFQDNGYNYVPPKIVPNQTFPGYPDRNSIYPSHQKGHVLNYKYTDNFPSRNIYSQQFQPQNYYTNLGQPISITPYGNEIWKRKADYERLKRSLRHKRSQKIISKNLEFNKFSNSTLHRNKRQSTLTGETLCQTRSQFIVPRAALNNKGNWMYVVNMPEVDNRVTQLVKSETCVSQTCNGLCSLPQGYSSRCEQKYVQKRLVALEGGGNQLYNDVFWFPSCCVCTISNS